MYNITLICTRHKEIGKCNSFELEKLMESIQPDIIFEELSQSNFDKSYREGFLKTVETDAIKAYLQNHIIRHIPVDTYPRPYRYDEQVEYMYDRIIKNIRIE